MSELYFVPVMQTAEQTGSAPKQTNRTTLVSLPEQFDEAQWHVVQKLLKHILLRGIMGYS